MSDMPQKLDRTTRTLAEWNGSEWVEIKRRWTIDPETFQLVGAGDGPFTGQEFTAIERPACPVCGDIIQVEPVSIERVVDAFPSYIPGNWRCPQGCDPRPRRR